ncbi:hypothetical protein EOA79_02295 [Mesorhizobium sp. M1A.F.Ca.IN.020.03.2.1]|nr:hypothetical protein EOA79_02295 [Mesorhizobium sp. M1A.F.Ca.IN.020.03.2.1]
MALSIASISALTAAERVFALSFWARSSSSARAWASRSASARLASASAIFCCAPSNWAFQSGSAAGSAAASTVTSASAPGSAAATSISSSGLFGSFLAIRWLLSRSRSGRSPGP